MRTRPLASQRLTRWLFMRALGLTFLIAFVSLWVQVHGLVGANGILPANEFLDRAHEALGSEAYARVPTLCWIDSSDGFLTLLCAAGTALSLLLIVGVAPLPALLLLWAIYLSLTNVGSVFLSFQWDVLLLETAFLALFYAPWQLRPRLPGTQCEPSRLGLWLLRLLLFKLMLLSGAVKLICLDETWWGLTALDYHYYTQPLPTWVSWYAHHLPTWFQKFSVVVMFVIELGAPLLIFFGRRARVAAFVAIVSLMLLIGVTGNYNFFNLLAVVLCITLLDDRVLRRFVPRRLRASLIGSTDGLRDASDSIGRSSPLRMPARVGAVAALILLLAISGMAFVEEMVRTQPPAGVGGTAGAILDWSERRLLTWGRPWLLAHSAPFRTVNGYGLFRRMTTSRTELILEGSWDGRTWQEIEFMWKPGDPGRRPAFVQPHQPRLDWQMWFAALNVNRAAHWLERLAIHILRGTPDVLDLLGDPLPDGPPRLVRLATYSYQFTDPDARRATGNWWRRERLATGRPISLRNRPNRGGR